MIRRIRRYHGRMKPTESESPEEQDHFGPVAEHKKVPATHDQAGLEDKVPETLAATVEVPQHTRSDKAQTITGLIEAAVIAALLLVVSLGYTFYRYSRITSADFLLVGYTTIACGIFAAVSFVPNRVVTKFVSPHFGTIGFVAAGINVPYWYWYHHVRDVGVVSDFYSVVAQVIPVLVLATLVDLGHRDADDSQVLIVVFFAAFGELSSLFALAYSRDTSVLFSFVCSALIGVLASFALSVLVKPTQPASAKADEAGKAS